VSQGALALAGGIVGGAHVRRGEVLWQRRISQLSECLQLIIIALAAASPLLML
jgi:hypothetical protein